MSFRRREDTPFYFTDLVNHTSSIGLVVNVDFTWFMDKDVLQVHLKFDKWCYLSIPR